MRPIQLTMTAFGPFAGSETIEFDRLGNNPLFLINGPTGSGKTTILDGICFALYGATTGNERDAKQMRCDQAAPDVLTEVELSFALGDSVYRIRRQPEQLRPKAKGEGTTSHSAWAELVQINLQGREQLLVAAKVGEANDTIQSLTGLSADQFRQVMVLPQGKFRELLMASSREREAIFGQLFQTQIYKQVEDQLKEQARTLSEEVKAQRNKQKGILETAEVENIDALNTQLGEKQPEHEAAAKRKKETTQVQQQARDELKAAQRIDIDFNRLADSERQLRDLADQGAQCDAKREQQMLAEKANRLSSLFNEHQRCNKQLENANGQYQKAQDEKTASDNQLAQSAQVLETVTQREPELDQAKQQVTQLQGYGARVTQLEHARSRNQQAMEALEKAKSSLDQAQKTARTLADKLKKAETTQQVLAAALQSLGDRKLVLKTLADQLELKQEQVQIRQQIQVSEETLGGQQQLVKEAQGQHAKVAQAATRVELAWHQGQAASLAATLGNAEPCPVCGSTEHPQPATSDASIPTQDQLNQARKKASDAKDQLTDSEKILATLQSKRTHLHEQLTTIEVKLGELAGLPEKTLQQRHDTLLQEVTRLNQQQCQQEQLAKTVQTLKCDHNQSTDAVTMASDYQGQAATDFATSLQQVVNAEKELPEAYRTRQALEEAIAQGNKTIAGLDLEIRAAHDHHKNSTANNKAVAATLNSTEQARNNAAQEQAVAQAQWLDSLQISEFDDEKQFHLALVDDAMLTQLKKQIYDYDKQCDQAKGAIATQQQALKGQQKPALDALQTRLNEVTHRQQQVEQQFQEIDERVRALVAARQKLEKVRQQTAELESRYSLIGTLSEVASGNTGNKVSLQRFVLSVLLDDVLLEASERLKMMSKGRYQLFRFQDKAKGGKASGLDLVVEDAYTGKQRAVETLSGGESFMAALSLALGLSDIVQAYAGGIRLDTLFIDEGFGSLDPESLQLAMNTLIDLQAAGRMIGIISHVPELKEWMNVRLDVIPSPGGSRTMTVLP